MHKVETHEAMQTEMLLPYIYQAVIRVMRYFIRKSALKDRAQQFYIIGAFNRPKFKFLVVIHKKFFELTHKGRAKSGCKMSQNCFTALGNY